MVHGVIQSYVPLHYPNPQAHKVCDSCMYSMHINGQQPPELLRWYVLICTHQLFINAVIDTSLTSSYASWWWEWHADIHGNSNCVWVFIGTDCTLITHYKHTHTHARARTHTLTGYTVLTFFSDSSVLRGRRRENRARSLLCVESPEDSPCSCSAGRSVGMATWA